MTIVTGLLIVASAVAIVAIANDIAYIAQHMGENTNEE